MTRLILILLIFSYNLSKADAQVIDDCGVKVTNFISVDPAIIHQNQLLFTQPYQLRIFIHIIADNDGSNLAVTNEAALNQYLEDTRIFYEPYGICFSLIGIDTIKNTILNNMYTDSSLHYNQLLSKLVPGVINVFFHKTLRDIAGTSFNGNAYAIPNNFCSIKGSLVGSTNKSTLAHEMGHDFGLYHTFDRANNTSETVPRSGSQSNCTVAGDLLCDTNADYNPTSSFINASCVYSGTATDSLGNTYDPPILNLMTYGRFECRDLFTVSQKDRMHYFIINTSNISGTINDDYLAVGNNGTVSSGLYFRAAKYTLSLVPSTSFTVTGSGKAYFTAGSAIDLKPGLQFLPGTGGLTDIHINKMCQ